MIRVTRLSGKEVIINADLIKFIEQTPDTMITLTTGDKIIVKEPMEQVVKQAIEYYRAIHRNFS